MARSLLEEASRMAPAREPYRALLAQVLMSQGEFDAAAAFSGYWRPRVRASK